jgi:hypothetical protein
MHRAYRTKNGRKKSVNSRRNETKKKTFKKRKRKLEPDLGAQAGALTVACGDRRRTLGR